MSVVTNIKLEMRFKVNNRKDIITFEMDSSKINGKMDPLPVIYDLETNVFYYRNNHAAKTMVCPFSLVFQN